MRGPPVNWDFQWGQIVGRAWADDDFKRRLLADPASALQEHGLTPPAGVCVEVLDGPDQEADDADDVMRLVLPARPSAEELSEDELCSVGGPGAAPAARCEWCRCERCSCERCHRCEFCRCEGCHHPPRPEDA
jgi:hypothetical protein